MIFQCLKSFYIYFIDHNRYLDPQDRILNVLPRDSNPTTCPSSEALLPTGSCPYPPEVSADTSGGYGESKPKDDDFLSDKMTSRNRIYMF